MNRLFAIVCAIFLLLSGCAFAQSETARPELELQRTVSREFVGPNGGTTLIYRVENTGNVTLQNVGVTDPLCGRVLALDELAPGEYRSVQIGMMVTKQCMSTPHAVWYYGGIRSERTLEALSISPAVNLLRAELSADRSGALKGETAVLNVTLYNEGNTQLYDLRLSDDTLGEIGSVPGVIEPGESRQWQFSARILQSSVFAVNVKARTGSGEEISTRTNEAEIVLAADPNGAQIRIEAAPAQGAARGKAAAEIVLHNDGGSTVENVTVSERSLGPLRTLSSLAPGKTRFTLEFDLDRAADMLFLAQFSADEDSRTTVLAEKLYLEPGTAEPEALLRGEPVQLGSSAYAVFMYGALSLLFLIGLAFLLRRAGIRRRRRIAKAKRARRMRLLRKNARMNEAEWVQTRPHKPVSPAADEKDI